MSGGFGPLGCFRVVREHHLGLLEDDFLCLSIELADELLDLRGGAVSVDAVVRRLQGCPLGFLESDERFHGDVQGLGERGQFDRRGRLGVVLVAGDGSLWDACDPGELDLGQPRLEPCCLDVGTDGHLQKMRVDGR